MAQTPTEENLRMSKTVRLTSPLIRKPLTHSKSTPCLTSSASDNTPLSSTEMHDPSEGRAFALGICAMKSKAESGPMKALLSRLAMSGDFRIMVFPEETILHEDISCWPRCDCFIAFFSTGFPLEKAIAYVKRVNPAILNSLPMQYTLRCRIQTYRQLQKVGLPVPRYIVVDHEAVKRGESTLEEASDYIVYDGTRLDKPFIEKPADADDHNNWVYYSKAAGGGCKKIFRKYADRSSRYHPELNEIRRDGVYIYEEFISTFGTDVKVYTVGPMFAHAEARKAPTLDGRVLRTRDGKEVRYPVILTEEEKLFAYKIVECFQQTICGFDILRGRDNRSVICDVNGWSFVKGNKKYYADCSHIVRILFLSKLQEKHSFIPRELPAEFFSSQDHENLDVDIFEDNTCCIFKDPQKEGRELRKVVVLMRHGDRQPKQKMKFVSREPLFLDLWKTPAPWGDDNSKTAHPMKEVKLKRPDELQWLAQSNAQVLSRLRQESQTGSVTSREDDECHTDSSVTSASWSRRKQYLCPLDCHQQLYAVLDDGNGFTGINRKIQLKPVEWDPAKTVVACKVVVKWGGALTDIGKVQSERLGRSLRVNLYPGDPNGLLRLHSQFRHDLKVYTSDEGRCQLTAAAFAKGLLDLDGELTPIFAQLANTHKILDDSVVSDTREHCKAVIDDFMNQNVELSENRAMVHALLHGNPTDRKALAGFPFGENVVAMSDVACFQCAREAVLAMGNPYRRMVSVKEKIDDLIDRLQVELDLAKFKENPCSRTTGSLRSMRSRWIMLQEAWFQPLTGRFDTSKLPDIADCIRYELRHHTWCLASSVVTARRVLQAVEPLAAFIGPAEYGISIKERVGVGVVTNRRLLQKVLADVLPSQSECEDSSRGRGQTWRKKEEPTRSPRSPDGNDSDAQEKDHVRLKNDDARRMGILTPWKRIRSRFYVASASHLQSILNILLFGCAALKEVGVDVDDIVDESCREQLEKLRDVRYLSHVIIRVWEVLAGPPGDRMRLTIEYNAGTNDQDILSEKKDILEHEDSETSLPMFCRLPRSLPVSLDLPVSSLENMINAVIDHAELMI